MKKSTFLALFVAALSVLVSCNGSNEQIAPASSPQAKASGLKVAADGCVHPSNNIAVGYNYWNGVQTPPSPNTNRSDINPTGATYFSLNYGNPNYQYFETLVKVDKISGPGTYSEPWHRIHYVGPTTYPIYNTSGILFISQAAIPDDGSVYRATFQTRTFDANYPDCYSAETVYTFEWTEDGSHGLYGN